MDTSGDPRTEETLKRPRAARCEHHTPLVAYRLDVGSVVARCLGCGIVGPVRETAEEARQALLGIGPRR
jgi:hypothetical protein